ncbi:MAG: DinB family protein [Pseudomonadota bacterium]
MISADYCRTMARYGRWQNHRIGREMEGLTAEDLTMDRGAFFGSIFGTLNHLLWGDTIWMSRFDGWSPPKVGIPGSTQFTPDLPTFFAAREKADAGIVAWSEGLTDARLDGDLSWHSGALGRDVTKPLALCVVHFFNHQTHHRGQIHAMLTGAGLATGDTDLFIMPEDA